MKVVRYNLCLVYFKSDVPLHTSFFFNIYDIIIEQKRGGNEQKKIMIFIAKSLTELSDLTNKLWKYPRPALDVLPKSLVLHNNVLKTC